MANNYGQKTVKGVPVLSFKGKDYVEVATRVNAVHDSGKAFQVLESTPIQLGERVVWRVVIMVGECQYVGNAEAKLDAPKNTADGTNPFECAETSALGRALAFAGFGSVERIASYDEVARSQPVEVTSEQVDAIKKLYQALGESDPGDLSGLSYVDAKATYEQLKAQLREKMKKSA